LKKSLPVPTGSFSTHPTLVLGRNNVSISATPSGDSVAKLWFLSMNFDLVSGQSEQKNIL
jgi:hypothetical protein